MKTVHKRKPISLKDCSYIPVADYVNFFLEDDPEDQESSISMSKMIHDHKLAQSATRSFVKILVDSRLDVLRTLMDLYLASSDKFTMTVLSITLSPGLISRREWS